MLPSRRISWGPLPRRQLAAFSVAHNGRMSDQDSIAMRAALIEAAAARAARFVRAAGARPVSPTSQAVEALARLDEALPPQPRAYAEVLQRLDDTASPATVVQTHGRYFGFVNGGMHAAANAAAILSSAWNQNLALPVMSPAAARIDAVAARWVCELLGLPDSAVATFCAGATIANLTGILAARDTLLDRLGWSVAERGLAGSPPLRVIASEQAHVSVIKALRVAGIGTAAIHWAPVDDYGRIDPRRLPDIDARTIVLLQAGNVNTGHSDPFAAVIERARLAGAWVHVDGAFGLWAAASPSRRCYVDGVEQADSWATDAHKWLNAGYDAGIVICRRAGDLRRSMAAEAAYVHTDPSESRALMHMGLQMSQRARAVETWSVIAALGRDGIARMIEQTCLHAERFGALLDQAGVMLLAPVVLNQVLVRFDDGRTTDAVIDAVQRDGTCWVGGTLWQGQKAMRISVSDAQTSAEDVEASAAAILRCWQQVRSCTADR